MQTPTRKLRIACIGAGISAMNLAYKLYHERRRLVCELVIYEANESIGGTVRSSCLTLLCFEWMRADGECSGWLIPTPEWLVMCRRIPIRFLLLLILIGVSL